MLTIRPPPVSSILGTIARATRKAPVILVSSTSRNPAGETCQNGSGELRNLGFDRSHPDPRVVDEKVDRAEAVIDLIRARLHGILAPDIQLKPGGRSPEFPRHHVGAVSASTSDRDLCTSTN